MVEMKEEGEKQGEKKAEDEGTSRRIDLLYTSSQVMKFTWGRRRRYGGQKEKEEQQVQEE